MNENISNQHRENYDEDREYYINDIDLQWNGKDEFTEVHKLSEETLRKVKEYALSDEETKEKKRKFEKKINEEHKITILYLK